MSDYSNYAPRDLSKYDSMKTEELEQILRQDATAPDGTQTDTELLLYVMEVLAKRKNTAPAGSKAQKAWESFQQNYMPEAPEEKNRKRIFTPLVRWAVAASVVIVLMILIPISSRAQNKNGLWDVFAQWTKSNFAFVSKDDGANATEFIMPKPYEHNFYPSLQVLLESHSIDPAIMPTWLPEGFLMQKTDVETTPKHLTCKAVYRNGDRELMILTKAYWSSNPNGIEVNKDTMELFTSNGVDYYISADNGRSKAMWIVGNYECCIDGDLTVEELKQMIASIE